jgi:preprotein translocase subunit SecG
MTSTLMIVQIVLTVLVTIIVLLQKSTSIGLGAYSGSNDSLFGAKGPASFLAKATMFLGLVFVLNTIALGYFYNQERTNSVIDGVELPEKALENPAPSVPVTPSASTEVPTAPSK